MSSAIVDHWSLDPLLFISAAVAAWNEIGVRKLAIRAPTRADERRRQALLFYAGLLVLDLTVASPVDYWSDRYFWVHMVQHLLLMFAAPVLLVAGAPWLPLTHGLRVGIRRRIGRSLLLGRWSTPLRFAGRQLSRPWTAIVGFNAVMILWHLPGPFDLAYRNSAVHIWLMHGSLLAFGVLFWLQFIGSYPLRPTLPPLQRASALFGTNVVMFILAMSIGMMTTHNLYPVYAHISGVGLSPLADQQIGAGILWVCGDFWCFPTLYRAVKEWIDKDDQRGAEAIFDRLIGEIR